MVSHVLRREATSTGWVLVGRSFFPHTLSHCHTRSRMARVFAHRKSHHLPLVIRWVGGSSLWKSRIFMFHAQSSDRVLSQPSCLLCCRQVLVSIFFQHAGVIRLGESDCACWQLTTMFVLSMVYFPRLRNRPGFFFRKVPASSKRLALMVRGCRKHAPSAQFCVRGVAHFLDFHV